MMKEYGAGEVKYPFDIEWDVEWKTADDVVSVDGRRSWWKHSEGESEVGVDTNEEDSGHRDEVLPGEHEQVFHGGEKDFVVHLRRVEALVKGVAVSRQVHFEAIQGKQGRLKFFKSLHGEELLKLVKKGCNQRCVELPVVDQNPFVGVYHKVIKHWGDELRELTRYGVMKGGVVQTVNTLNQLIDDMRREVGRPIIKTFAMRIDRSAKAREKKAIAIIDRCFEHRSRLLVIRVDLGYRKGRFIDSHDFAGDMEKVKQHWAVLSADIKKGLVVPGVMEVFSKLEYGVLSGFHFHVVVIMKGSDHQEDITYARLIGQYWCQEVVGEDGRYFNCNRIKHRYTHTGIGEINYYEKDKITTLKEVVVRYVAKSDYYMGALSPSKKTFFQSSCMKHAGGINRGRPRRYPLVADTECNT